MAQQDVDRFSKSSQKQIACDCSKTPDDPWCSEICASRKKFHERVVNGDKKGQNSKKREAVEAMFNRLDDLVKKRGYFTEYDLFDEIKSLETLGGNDYLETEQDLLEVIRTQLPQTSIESTSLLGEVTQRMSANAKVLANHQLQNNNPDMFAKLMSQSNVLAKLSADYFSRVGALGDIKSPLIRP